MTWLTELPEWFGTAFIGAVLAILGYLSKSIIDWLKKQRRGKTKLYDRLQELESLLNESKSLFLTQNDQARRLLRMLRDNHAEEIGENSIGFENIFVCLCEHFTQEEKELHSIIRSITMNSLLRVNQETSRWLKEDLIFKTGKAPFKENKELEEYLRKLEHHLNLWDDKYKVWIPDNPKHALVYLADEANHGVGFPVGIEDFIGKVLANIK